MTARGQLRDAKEMIGPAIEAMVGELDVPASDGPLLALIRRQARVIDHMSDAEAVSMMPNHAGPLLRGLAELEERARKRGRDNGPQPANPVRDLRASHAAFMAKQR